MEHNNYISGTFDGDDTFHMKFFLRKRGLGRNPAVAAVHFGMLPVAGWAFCIVFHQQLALLLSFTILYNLAAYLFLGAHGFVFPGAHKLRGGACIGSEPSPPEPFIVLLNMLPMPEHLTAREKDVLLLILGRSNTEGIARLLQISQNTVRTHIRHICEKFGVNSKNELLRLSGTLGSADNFSQREKEVLSLVAAGKNDSEIAEALFISTNTVRTHIHHICKKSGVGGRKELYPLLESMHPMQCDTGSAKNMDGTAA